LISKIIIPDLGATGGDVLFVSWLIEPGDTVRAGQPLFLVETDKATVEVETFRDGVVRELLAEAGDSVPLGGVVAIVADSMEEPLLDEPGENRPSEPEIHLPPLPDSTTEKGNGRILVSPIARRMAKVEGINLIRIKGTGRQGQILKRDIENALSLTKTKSDASIEIRREPIPAMRQAIARRTHQSKQEIPHYYADITVDMSAILDLHREAGEWARNKGWVSPTITDLCLLATAMALGNCPGLNASFLKDEILYYQAINIGLVVGLEAGGMLVPVVHHADAFNLYTLASVTRRLIEQAKKGILSESALSGGTFSLSNLGMYGVDSFTAIINPPQAGMLALGAVRELPVVRGGAIVPRPMMTATLSADHRLVDGIVAAQFLAGWKEIMEQPGRRMLELPKEIG